MNEQQWTHMDKSEWGNGPWQSEPDKMQWTDEATGMACLIVRAPPTGSLCGYVAVPPGHPLHGLGYDEAHDQCEAISVHGGLTFADKCHESDDQAQGVCHIPAPGQPDDVWWFGFDCSHYRDFSPAKAARLREHGSELVLWGGNQYRPLEYVRTEVMGLAQALADHDA